jgi:hypothetical protein
MIFVRKIDEQGFFIEDAFVEKITELTIETPCPSGFYKPKWNFETETWAEGATVEYIDNLKNVAIEPTHEDYLLDLDFRVSMLELGI